MVALIAIFAYYHKMVGLIPPLMAGPTLLLVRHCYRKHGSMKNWMRSFVIFYICCSVIIAALYMPSHHLVFACFAILVLIGLMNSQFYIFLAGKRGVASMFAAIPFHLLYHFYNGFSFIIGVSRHYWAAVIQKMHPTATPASSAAPRV